jgi:membrane-associated protein
MLQWLHELHSASGISHLIEVGGLYVLIAIVFAETGLLAGFFLPGDSLLITAGVLANPLNPNHISTLDILVLNIALACAVLCGDQLGYFLGTKAGAAIWNRPDGRFYKRKHLEAAQNFYQTYGGLSVIAAKYVPIFRTFVPFVAGIARMPYRKFAIWDMTGGILWISSLLWIGYFLGQTPLANRLDKLIVVVIFVSLLPMAFGAIKRWLASQKSAVRAE